MRLHARAATARKKQRKKAFPVLSALRWLLLLFCAFYLLWALAFPSASGQLGLALHDALLEFLGGSAYLAAVFLAYGLLLAARAQKTSGLFTMACGALLCLASCALSLGLLGQTFSHPAWGGAAGNLLARLGESSLGRGGSGLAAVIAAGIGTKILFDVRWTAVLPRFAGLLVQDYQNWAQNRRALKDMVREAASKHLAPAPAGIVPLPQAAEENPRQAPLAAEPAPAPIVHAPAIRTAKPKPVPRPENNGGYHLPPLGLLQAKKGTGDGRPTEAEIRDAVSSLESTLASFEIQAKVSGISPGPVITRYEVSPSPGVTVSSIVARSNDIALAMRAKGIRMIAPIPGKAAIGIEIPNQRPAGVTLREVLESGALDARDSCLVFALGLASDGAPLCADLQTMPHLLVAGATNSGKSVMVHSLIASILFRRRPDEVKFLLIDPKRIELTLYDGIPHLYDPKIPASEVRVLTHAKQAAQSLKALIRVMEKRYEKFQEYRVRDILAYNREAARRGEPAEFYIVVVIDELADLMVVARDVVEDSIQRLTQMARAVGIHLVLATQRPSVDVITGVIKANLPSRIALRVASKVDSKVILDTVGAEALLGKGDALYLTPGQDPARIQGCFVSTQEIGALVEHLKTQGSPDYPTLETMTAVGEADLSQFGVEPLEFTQSLKLVLERRRVSQDLLKSQFGSSARATNLLSLLEVKGFIHKPEGSNRWDIHFDKIEDYLRTHFPQVRLDKPGI